MINKITSVTEVYIEFPFLGGVGGTEIFVTLELWNCNTSNTVLTHS